MGLNRANIVVTKGGGLLDFIGDFTGDNSKTVNYIYTNQTIFDGFVVILEKKWFLMLFQKQNHQKSSYLYKIDGFKIARICDFQKVQTFESGQFLFR